MHTMTTLPCTKWFYIGLEVAETLSILNEQQLIANKVKEVEVAVII